MQVFVSCSIVIILKYYNLLFYLYDRVSLLVILPSLLHCIIAMAGSSASSSTPLFTDEEARIWNQELERAHQRAAAMANRIENIKSKCLLSKLVMPEDKVIWEARFAHLPEALVNIIWEQSHEGHLDDGGDHGVHVKKKVIKRKTLHRRKDERMSNFIRREEEADAAYVASALHADPSIPRTPRRGRPHLPCPPFGHANSVHAH